MLGFVGELERALESVPGVEAASVSTALPMEFRERRAILAEDPIDPNARHSVNVTWATPRFFETLGIGVRHGRSFEARDRADSGQVVIVSEGLARMEWGDENVVGRRLSWQLTETGEPSFAEVVGVVGAVNDGPLGSEPTPHLYVPAAQFNPLELQLAIETDSPWGRVFRIAVQTSGSDPTLLTQPVVSEVRNLDRSLAVADIQPLDQIMTRGVSAQRLSAGLVGAFALTALLIAAVGLYGVLAYATERRRREFGVRLALGAEGSSVVGLVLRQGMLLAALGLGLGLLAALGLSRLVASVLFQTSPNDPTTLIGVALVLLLAATLASWLPAWEGRTRRSGGCTPTGVAPPSIREPALFVDADVGEQRQLLHDLHWPDRIRPLRPSDLELELTRRTAGRDVGFRSLERKGHRHAVGIVSSNREARVRGHPGSLLELALAAAGGRGGLGRSDQPVLSSHQRCQRQACAACGWGVRRDPPRDHAVLSRSRARPGADSHLRPLQLQEDAGVERRSSAAVGRLLPAQRSWRRDRAVAQHRHTAVVRSALPRVLPQRHTPQLARAALVAQRRAR